MTNSRLHIGHLRLGSGLVGKQGEQARIVVPEWLDELPADDPRAQRSRKELRWINALMGNERWILSQLEKHPAATAKGVLELGAGEGHLLRKIHGRFPQHRVCGADLLERPASLPQGIAWRAGDLTTEPPTPEFGVLVANLFLHHFTDDALSWFAAWLPHVSLVILNEPLRRPSSHFWGLWLRPFLHEVTRHDMHVSIDAGFLPGELPRLWPAQAAQWEMVEKESWPGAYRSVWRRK